MEIGQKFTVNYRLDWDYEERRNEYNKMQKYRYWRKIVFDEPMEVYLLGLRYKREGWYHRGYTSGGFMGDEYNPPYLSGAKSVKCALVTPSMKRNGFLVYWDDLEKAPEIHRAPPNRPI